jgi:hypothetical protein
VGFLLLLYAIGVSPYVIASIASVLVGLDAQQASEPPTIEEPTAEEGDGVRLSRSDLEALQRILERSTTVPRNPSNRSK